LRRAGPVTLGALLALAACGGGKPQAVGSGGGGDSAAGPAAGPIWFAEEARARGLDFVLHSGAAGQHLMPEIMCGGAALFDADGDGDLDAYLVQAGGVRAEPAQRPPNQLFANQGGGLFEDVTAASGAGDRGYGMGAAVGDADGDGRPDLFVANLGADALLSNEGGLAFRDVTATARVADDAWSTSAAFLDADADGDLDLYVACYVVWDADQELDCSNDLGTPDYCSPTAYGAPALDLFYLNEGSGVFRDASARSGVQAAAGNGLGVACADFDQDGFTDVFVANDQNANHLWRNRGDATFEDAAYARGVAFDRDGKAKAGMGVGVGDVDEDGDEDLLVCNLQRETDSFFVNEGAYFTDRTHRAGLAQQTRALTRFGAGFADFDQDGRLDLFEANGRVMRRAPAFVAGDDYAEPKLLFRGGPGGVFAEVPNGGTEKPLPATSRGAAFGDVDGDGAVDVLVVNRDAPAQLLINRVAGRGAWIGLRVVDGRGADALGAALLVRSGARTFRREVRSASSYLSASSAVVHVGLGAASGVDAVRVRWPDGREKVFGPLAAGAVHTLPP